MDELSTCVRSNHKRVKATESWFLQDEEDLKERKAVNIIHATEGIFYCKIVPAS
jgi:hypothetical protein